MCEVLGMDNPENTSIGLKSGAVAPKFIAMLHYEGIGEIMGVDGVTVWHSGRAI
jgi:hypothetical protein